MADVLDWMSAAAHPELLAPAVIAALAALGEPVGSVEVAAIDPDLADTDAFCARYGVGADESANCVVIAGRRGGAERLAACVVLATTRADVNGVARRRLDVRKASFADHDATVDATAMESGGITPLGLPAGWPVLIDAAVARHPRVIVGSGVRRSKLALPGAVLAALPAAEIVEGLGHPTG